MQRLESDSVGTGKTLRDLSESRVDSAIIPSWQLADVTASDIDAWRLWLVTDAIAATKSQPARGMATSSANKHAQRVKKLIAQAVRAKLIPESPSADQRIGPEVNRTRDHYIDRATAKKVLDACDVEWALIFGLCRFSGFRCPTEVLGLTWADIDWAAGRIRIDSVKTGLRYCPIFPELRPLLEAAFDAAPPNTLHCIRGYRGNETNLSPTTPHPRSSRHCSLAKSVCEFAGILSDRLARGVSRSRYQYLARTFKQGC